mgnify:CR=1 FL=1|jgi:hypothetical protein|tara:strand:- start:3088 stop:3789 length:702 start_codon:yes stop_codon:yes gene_type:complete
MSIITKLYFKNEIYLPHAKEGITGSVTDVEAKVVSFIDEYEQDCLIKSLGPRLALEFFTELDTSEPTLIKAGSNVKWNALLNGETYTRPNGEQGVWKGIRRKRNSLGTVDSDVYDNSFLANYVYFFYESNNFITTSGSGNGRLKSANIESVIPNQKVTKSWNKFVYCVQGKDDVPFYYIKTGLFGGCAVDYYNHKEGEEISMYEFIDEKNELVKDTYQFFEPKKWEFINQQGI